VAADRFKWRQGPSFHFYPEVVQTSILLTMKVTEKDMRELRGVSKHRSLSLHHAHTFPFPVASAIFAAVALVATVNRLYLRRGRLWWDDWCAAIALIGTFCVKGSHIAMTLGVLSKPARRHSDESAQTVSAQTSSASLTSKIALNYILAVGYFLELW
jgi:hypothetical protein